MLRKSEREAMCKGELEGHVDPQLVIKLHMLLGVGYVQDKRRPKWKS
jgi:hypothetical protein